MAGRVLSAIKMRLGDLIHEAAKFGVVGLAAMVIDVGLFNVLMYGGGQVSDTDEPARDRRRDLRGRRRSGLI